MLLNVIILLLAIPVGFFLAYFTKDELIAGRKWFKIITLTAFLAGIWFYLIKQTPVALTAFFIAITSFISLNKSYDKRWTKKV